MEPLTDGLWYERCTASTSHVGVDRRAENGAIEPVLRVRRGAMNARRVHVDLVLLGGDRTVEVSFHPAATVDLVRGHAQRRGSDANGWMAPLLRAIVEDAARWGAWTPSVPDGVGAPVAPADRAWPLLVLGGVTHPLLGLAYDGGAAPAGEIPRWASPALAEATLPAGALRLFGAGATSKSVVRALCGWLARPVLPWWQLGLASAMAVVGAADDVAAVLWASGAPAVTPVRSPSVEDRAALQSGLALLERARAKRLALDALTTGGECGAVRLADALRALIDVKDDVRWPPPVRLAELEDVCLRATAVDPAPRPSAAPPRLRPASRVADVPDLADVVPTPSWTVARRAPAVTSVAGAAPATGDAFAHPPAVRALEGCLADRSAGAAVGDDLELVLPRTRDELRAWGRMLGNCLGDFGPAVAAHRSVILGVKERGALVAAVELLPTLRDVRQFLGPRNRRPPAHVTEPVLRRLLPRLAVG